MAVTIDQALAFARNARQAGHWGQAERTFREILLADPNQPDALLELAAIVQNAGDLDFAASCLRRFIRVRPLIPEGHLRLGNALIGQRRLDDAVACYREAIRLRPEYVEAHTNLGTALQDQGRLTEAESCHRRAIELQPEFFDARYNLANALKEQGRNDEAIEAYLWVIERRPDFAQAQLNLGLTRLQSGDFARGLPGYEWRGRCGQPPPREFPQPAWDGSNLAGRTLLVHTEQGFGDTFLFGRFVERIKPFAGDCRIIFECPEPIIAIMSSLPGPDLLIARGEDPPPFDARVSLPSLAGLLGTTVETIPAHIPYLQADPRLVERWKSRLPDDGRFRVGIAWQGDPTYRWDGQRSIPLLHFAPLGNVAGARFVCLQKGFGRDQLPTLAGRFEMLDLDTELDESGSAFADTAAVMSLLDLVITSDTATAHLAGALGVPVWVVLGKQAHWLWLLDRDDSPWYPSMKLFRQRWHGDWPEVFERVREALAREVERKGRRSQPATGQTVEVEISLGELIDKITILRIKAEKITDAGRRADVARELDLLETARGRVVPASERVAGLTAELEAINRQLWDVEDELRRCEVRGQFKTRFVKLARSVYQLNDQRAALKRTINVELGSKLIEHKEYADPKGTAAD